MIVLIIIHNMYIISIDNRTKQRWRGHPERRPRPARDGDRRRFDIQHNVIYYRIL